MKKMYAVIAILAKYSSILMFFKLAPHKRIIIIGHMRSGSSLLSHILLNNPEISGIGETHTTYKDKNYHLQLIASILAKKRLLYFLSKRKFVMDKVLHKHILDDSILMDENTFIILLVRTPEEVIPSILRTFEITKKPYTFEKAFDHYFERLNCVLDTYRKYSS